MSEFLSWPSIEGFHNVWRNHARFPFPGKTDVVKYRSKIKLHGTNAAVRIDPDGTVTAQKRSSDITPENDNAGFAAWVAARQPYFHGIRDHLESMVIFGEWAGPGVQKNVAVSVIPRRHFFVFAIHFDDRIVADPDDIRDLMAGPESLDDLDIRILPWHGETMEIDFTDEFATRKRVEDLNTLIEEIDAVDPYIREAFGISGVGEGLVFYPADVMTREFFSTYSFKAKGGSHQKVKDHKAARVDTWVTDSNKEFVERFLTEARLEQAVQEACDGVAEPRRTPDFLKWIGNDVRKESQAELEVSGLEWKSVAKMVNMLAVSWFKKRCQQIEAVAA